MRALALALAFVAAAACARPLSRPAPGAAEISAAEEAVAGEALALLLERGARVLAVAYRLRTEAAELCGDDVAPILGVLAAQRQDFRWSFAELAEQVYGVGDRVRVLHVLEGSPAAEAGVQVDDEIAAVNGRAIERTDDVYREVRDAASAAPRLELERAGRRIALELPRRSACRQEARLVVSGLLTTVPHPNGVDLLVTTGMVEFAESDDELAIALAHEMAHGVLAGTTGSYLDSEAAADRLGLRLVARAGFDASVALPFWERMTLEHPWAIRFDAAWPDARELPHGRMPARVLAMRAALAELARERATH